MTDVTYHEFSGSKEEFDEVSSLIAEDLSEPYSIYVYRFFLDEWPDLCMIARNGEGEAIGVIISKLETHRDVRLRGYIGMLAVKQNRRGKGIARLLVKQSIDKMIVHGADEIVLETEVVNKAAMNLYESFGFMRSKRLYRYYLNQHDAYRLILPITERSLNRGSFLTPLDGGIGQKV